MLRVFLLPALATALQLSTFAPVSTGRAARATAGVWMQEVEASIEVSSDAEASMDTHSDSRSPKVVLFGSFLSI